MFDTLSGGEIDLNLDFIDSNSNSNFHSKKGGKCVEKSHGPHCAACLDGSFAAFFGEKEREREKGEKERERKRRRAQDQDQEEEENYEDYEDYYLNKKGTVQNLNLNLQEAASSDFCKSCKNGAVFLKV